MAMTLRQLSVLVLLFLVGPAPAFAEAKVAVLGLSDEKSLETVHLAVEAASSPSAQSTLHLKPWFVGLSGSAGLNVELAEKVAADPEVLGVVLHGEAAAAPEIVAVLRKAGLAVVAASSWAQPRGEEPYVTWLCPSADEMAGVAAQYARREARQSQVAVLDNGAPTAVAAAKAFATRFRNLGGKVVFEGEWQGSSWGLTRTTKALKANWPQMLFFAGEGEEAGRLVVAMKDEKELKATDLLGQPTVFDPAFFNTARVKSVRTRGFFPCPNFVGTQPLVRLIGIAFPKTSAEYRAYVQVAYKKPGRWAPMLFDATALLVRGIRSAAEPGAPTRGSSRDALLKIEGYRGIRGVVRFSPRREPLESKAMVYYALNRVNKKEMQWREKNYGPPF